MRKVLLATLVVVLAIGFAQATARVQADESSSCRSDKVYQVPADAKVSRGNGVILVEFSQPNQDDDVSVTIDCKCEDAAGQCWERYNPATGQVYCRPAPSCTGNECDMTVTSNPSNG